MIILILQEKETIRTDVENVFLQEMVEEDNSFLYLNESIIDSALNAMVEDEEHSIFEGSINEEDIEEDPYDEFYIY